MHSVLRDLTCTECSVPRIEEHFQCNAQCALALCVLLASFAEHDEREGWVLLLKIPPGDIDGVVEVK